MTSRPDPRVIAAFLIFVAFAGANAIGVRFVLREMGPFWAASIRFAIAGLLLVAYMVAVRRPVPRGDRLIGTTLFGVFGFGLAYIFLYEALKDAPAGTTMLTLAIVPLLTVLLAVGQGVERLRVLACRRPRLHRDRGGGRRSGEPRRADRLARPARGRGDLSGRVGDRRQALSAG